MRFAIVLLLAGCATAPVAAPLHARSVACESGRAAGDLAHEGIIVPRASETFRPRCTEDVDLGRQTIVITSAAVSRWSRRANVLVGEVVTVVPDDHYTCAQAWGYAVPSWPQVFVVDAAALDRLEILHRLVVPRSVNEQRQMVRALPECPSAFQIVR